MNRFIGLSILLFSFCLAAWPAGAQVSRAWVASSGFDNPTCTRTAPCLTLQAAHNNLLAGGEIDCVDAGDFGGVLITKSLTFDCAAGLMVDANSPFVIRVDAPGVNVTLRNLSINGLTGLLGNPSFGIIGIEFKNGAQLFVENCKISGYHEGAATGISFTPAGNANLFVSNTLITDNTKGIVIGPAASAQVSAVISNTKFDLHSAAAISVSGDSRVMLNNSEVVKAGTAIVVGGAKAMVELNNSTVTGNTVGLNPVNGGTIVSLGNNAVVGNFVDGNPTSKVAPK